MKSKPPTDPHFREEVISLVLIIAFTVFLVAWVAFTWPK